LLTRTSIVKDELSATCIEEGWKTIVTTTSLSDQFLRAYEQTCGRPSNEAEWIVADNIFDAITRKVYHSRLNVVVREFQLTETGRTGNKASSDSLRVQLRQGGLKSDTSARGENKATATEKTTGKENNKKKRENENLLGDVCKRYMEKHHMEPQEEWEKRFYAEKQPMVTLPSRTYYKPVAVDAAPHSEQRVGMTWWPHLPVPEFVPDGVVSKTIMSPSYVENMYRLYGPGTRPRTCGL
jgi:hypothetical protein